ncbi:uncharacterized protein LOC111088248 [Limulus polyphemus]|uniref:Uncharacterized protein LOC111088248 n=1 Tax=Limulus polyphemus TaxID=6850 RepID=A0ABM1TC82_LIMPO|nr:uncharacterized protein LOC111088248 [Limulus polyphemus]
MALLIGGGLLFISATTVEELVLEGDLNYQDDTVLVLLPAIFSLFAKNTLRVATPLLFIHAIKTFPTGIRCLMLGTCVFWLHAAELIAPHLTWLSDHTIPYIPLTVCGILLIISGGLTLTLPACQKRPLPNTLNEAEEMEYNYSMHASMNKNRYCSQDHSNSLFFMSSQSTNDIRQGEIDALRREAYHTKDVQIEDEEEQSLQYSETIFPVKGSVFFGSLRYARHEGMHEPRDDQGDSQSRLTDLEDELTKVWELNKHHSAPDTKEEGPSKDLDVFFGSNRRADWGIGETNF